jgi:hypothetical protein
MLLICAYVVFFSALAGAIGGILQTLDLSPILQAIIFGALELSGGVNQAATRLEVEIALPLCALFAGWSGMSVHCQLLSICEGRNLSFRKYFLAKLLQGILCALLCMIAIKMG